MRRRSRVNPHVAWSTAAVVVLASFAIVGLILELVAPAPQGPPLSSYATTPRGVAAWAELLVRDGHRVTQLRRPLAAAELPANATLVVLGADLGATTADTRRLRRFLGAGGWLVLGGTHSSRASALRGHVVGVRDTTFLENRGLGLDGSALRALRLAGPTARPVIFDEAVHGFGVSSGLGALPVRWWLALGGLALAGGWWALSRARRLGGADPLPAPTLAPRSAYVEAMAGTLVRVKDRELLAERLQTTMAGEDAFGRSLRQ